MLTATSPCDAPARCGAFVDEWRSVGADEGDRCTSLIRVAANVNVPAETPSSKVRASDANVFILRYRGNEDEWSLEPFGRP
jgi:hypothetical protein